MRRPTVSYRLLLALAAVVVASLSLPTTARAQAVYGSIAGTIEDSTGAALPGVNVTITSVERKTADTVVTNGSGNYSKDRLLPGTYSVKAELSGFRPALVQPQGCVVKRLAATCVPTAATAGSRRRESSCRSALTSSAWRSVTHSMSV